MKLEKMSDGLIADKLHSAALSFRKKNSELSTLLFEAEKRLQEKARAEANANSAVPRGQRLSPNVPDQQRGENHSKE